MAITDKAKATLVRLNKISEARDGVDEAQALDSLRGRLLQFVAPIKILSSNAKLLANQGVALSGVTEIGSTLETVKKVSMRFVEIPKSTTLKQGTRWTGLISKLEVLVKKVGEAQTNDWKVFFGSKYFGGISPTQREAKLAQTPQNKKALESYKKLYQNFIAYRLNIPKDAEDFKSLEVMSEQLAQIKFQEDDDVPEDVRKFFEATNTGAGLELLTIEVIEWLRNNNLLSSYIVRAKLN
ncbi:hypothetical protein [Ferrovum myxofaciens]|uniref:Uncharacterized protein n=1 Tax=Ferrovum myxofaciens TaxID=416213 RepID=A0A9E6MZU8_9PROT|nr:hypothetical protein [Ferrovum myxofaciens]QKE37689.1 MAG: hypothetical protein HO273_02185 [Ferrovum myxofaciens]QWY75350.1 MAG: hypothetical protein JVY19_02620 [Ferrovum myxofaciens]QWY78090.1 MAG: hypothetical protein JZL65_03140 [Ferrovum myxofaciens]